MVPYLQPNGRVMMDLKLWFQRDLLKVTKVWLLTVALFVLLFSAKCVIFWSLNNTTKLGVKDLLKDQQWRVERDSNLIPPQYRPNALTTTLCTPLINHKVSMKNVWNVYSENFGSEGTGKTQESVAPLLVLCHYSNYYGAFEIRVSV